jgi:hypothetical protein
MEYRLRALGHEAYMSITKDEFYKLENAKSGLGECLSIEEKFDIVIENYLEFETTMLSSTARNLILGDQDYQSFYLDRGLFNRRLANLLSAGRIYVDHTKQHINRVFKDSSNAPDIITFVNPRIKLNRGAA